jgi:SLT domain-containing protein
MFRKIIINASSNLKRGLELGTKIKSNGWLDIGTEGVKQRSKGN